MKATKAGIGEIPGGSLLFSQYVRVKYEGLFPPDYPKRHEILDAQKVLKDKHAPHKHARKVLKIVANVSKEWKRQQ